MSGIGRVIVVGGSAGSFQVVLQLLQSLPASYPHPLLLCLHRLRHVRSGFVEALSTKSSLPLVEPIDKELMQPGTVYLAPSNYHMYVELGNRFALSTEELVNHSRPAIDLTFYSVACAFRERAVGIILSGANGDGAAGLQRVKRNGGYTIVQEPTECEVRAMVDAAMRTGAVDAVLSTQGIAQYLMDLA